jgi:hypothetical protein
LIPDGNDFTAIAAGFGHCLALRKDGTIVGWGLNDANQAIPPDGNDFVAIGAGNQHSLAIKKDGSIVGWGDNTYQQSLSPTGFGFDVIAVGMHHNLAIRKCNFTLVGDLNDDCKTDFYDLAIVTNTWLIDCYTEPTHADCIPK